MSQTSSMPLVLSRLVPAMIFGLFFYTGYLIMTTRYVPESPMKSMRSWQTAAVPHGIPVDASKPEVVQKFDPRMQLYSAFEAAAIPVAQRFDSPMGTESGTLIYNAQPFWEMNSQRGGHHTGDDLNGIGGQNTDLNDPVYSVANGWVAYAGEPSTGWGNVVVIAHRTPKGEILNSMYAHLNQMQVKPGQLVSRGELIGKVGTGNDNYLAHLHFEMQHADGLSPQHGYSMFPYDRINAEATVRKHRNAPADLLNASALSIIQRQEEPNGMPEMDQESALRLQEFFRRKAATPQPVGE